MFKYKGPTQVLISRFMFFLIIPALVCLPFFSVGVDMFGWFKKKEDVLLSSPVQGQLLDGNKPLSNITVTREIVYGKEYIDTATTDDNGYFQFTKKAIKSNKPNNMFDNDSIRQNIFIKINNEDIHLWVVRVFLTPANDTTLTRNLNNLICDINTPPKTYYLLASEHETEEFPIYTICNIK